MASHPFVTAHLTDAIAGLYPKTFLFSLFIAIHGYRRRSLELSGAVAATSIGYLTLANPNPTFGAALLSFYTIGNIATKYKQSIKSSFVDETDHPQSNAGKTTGTGIHAGRDWKQVLCNAWFGTACALLCRVNHLWSLSTPGSESGDLNIRLSKSLVAAALAFWAGCAGDTLASELGILSRSKPRLITNLREVPPGTNGAISLLGLAFSTLGGLVVGTVSALISTPYQARSRIIIHCGTFGLVCSAIDSLLGATLQQTLYSKAEKRVVSKRGTPLGGKREVIVISGRDLLTNNQVNLVSSTSTGILAGILTYYYMNP